MFLFKFLTLIDSPLLLLNMAIFIDSMVLIRDQNISEKYNYVGHQLVKRYKADNRY